MQNDGDGRFFRHRQKEICKFFKGRVGQKDLGCTDDYGRAEFLGGGDNAFSHFEVYGVEKTYAVFVFLGVQKDVVKSY